jgi:hypothetical protein
MSKIETISLKIRSCAICPFRMQIGITEVKEICYLQAKDTEPQDLEYSISPLGRDKGCPLPKKIKFNV